MCVQCKRNSLSLGSFIALHLPGFLASEVFRWYFQYFVSRLVLAENPSLPASWVLVYNEKYK